MNDIPTGWASTTLAEIAELSGGSTPKGVLTAPPGEIPFYKVSDMNASDGRFMADSKVTVSEDTATALSLKLRPAGTVIFPKVGGALHTNKKRVLRTRAAFDTNTMGAVPTAAVVPAFLYFWFSRINLSDFAYGSPVPQVSRDRIGEQLFWLPPLAEQDRIVSALEAELSRLDNANALIASVRRKAHRLAGSAFQLTGTPKSTWRKVAIDDTIQVVDYRGRTPPFAESGIPHLRSFNVKNGSVTWDGCAFVTEATYDQYMSRGFPAEGDLLFTTEAPMGEVAFAPSRKFCMAQRLMLLKPDPDVWLSEYLMYHLRSPWFQNLLRLRATGTTVKGISSRNFRPLQLYAPTIAEQEMFVARIRRIVDSERALTSTLAVLDARSKRLRSSILSAAFSGQLVSQNPLDESAVELLDHVRTLARRANHPASTTRRRRRSRTAAA